MYKSSTELIAKEFSREKISYIYKIFENANMVYEEVIKKDFFDSLYNTNVKGRILSYAVYRQFDPKYLTNNCPFEVKSATMAFDQKRVELKSDNVILTIAKVNNRNKLPSKSGYKTNYSLANWGIENQLYMEFLEKDIEIKQQPYYGMITYGINNAKLDFVDIIIPDSRYKTILDKVELKPKLEIVKTEDLEDAGDEERIINVKNLKKDVIRETMTLIEGGQ